MAAPTVAAIAKPTFPLRARFTKLSSPSLSLTRSSHTLDILKGKAYVFGGDIPSGTADSSIDVITLPTDESLQDTDYQSIPARAAPQASKARSLEEALEKRDAPDTAALPAPRAAHTSTLIDETIYIFGGRAPVTCETPPSIPPSTSNPPLDEAGAVHAFNTTTRVWTALHPQHSKCTSGVPSPRTHAACVSSPHPLPSGQGEDKTLSPIDETTADEGHGTVFLHGGYDKDGNDMRDIWAFDVASRVWSQWPDVPEPGVDGGLGLLACTESRLWRCGDGYGRVDWLEIVRDKFDDLGGVGELGVSPKTGKWESVAFGVMVGHEEAQKKVEEKMGKPKTEQVGNTPDLRKGAGLVALTTGQGRVYLVLLMGEKEDGKVLQDSWSFQLKSEKSTAATIKDRLMGLVGMQTGEDQWEKIEVVEATEEDGQLDKPKGLSRFAYADGGDWGVGSVVLWGGIGTDGKIEGDGWILTVE